MAEVSVLASTTRKFFWESGGCVTCWISFGQNAVGNPVSDMYAEWGKRTPMPARSKPVTESLRSRQLYNTMPEL